MFNKLIVGVDFSEISDRAVLTAATLAKGLGASVVLLHVLAPGSETADTGDLATSVRVGIETKLREDSAALAQEHGIKVDWGVVNGEAADEVATFTRRWGGEIIVIGSAGKSGVRRMIVGSVADRLVRISPVPVLVVGPEADPDGV